MPASHELLAQARRVFAAFDDHPGPLRCTELGDGLINETFLVSYPVRGGERRRVLQRINRGVLRDLDLLMSNLVWVTGHLQSVARSRYPGDWQRRVLRYMPTLEGDWYLLDEAGQGWRCCHYIEDTRVYRRAHTVAHAHAAARAFGEFLADLRDLPVERIGATVPGLHDTPARLAALRGAAERDPLGRAAEAGPELRALLERRATAEQLSRARVPQRVVHNDTKLNNVLFDRHTDRPLCVVDLDTVMPGSALHDFGDLVRSAAASGLEDAAGARLRLDLFEALVAGYLEGAGNILSDDERALLAVAPRVITLELAARFLTDYLQGDRYFKTARPGQNLDRCRAQLALLMDMEAQQRQMEQLVRDAGSLPSPRWSG